MDLKSNPETEVQPDQEMVRTLAYELWVVRGHPEGTPEVDWFAAEKQLTGEQSTLNEVIDIPAADPS